MQGTMIKIYKKKGLKKAEYINLTEDLRFQIAKRELFLKMPSQAFSQRFLFVNSSEASEWGQVLENVARRLPGAGTEA